MRTLAALLLFAVLTFTAFAVEPWLKAGDVVALIGGEDMVALGEEGWLETLVTWAQPHDHIRWRSLAWEGDTVFEQRRDLNYPTLEAQLDRMGATVVICQFGKMESFAGKEGVAAFTEAYEKLLARLKGEKFSGEKKWRIILDGMFDPYPRHYRDLEFPFYERMRRTWLGDTFTLPGHSVSEWDRFNDVKKRRIAMLFPSYISSYDEWEQNGRKAAKEAMAMPRNGTGGLFVPPMFLREPDNSPKVPMPERLPEFTKRNWHVSPYRDAIRAVATKGGAFILDDEGRSYLTRDQIHIIEAARFSASLGFARQLGVYSASGTGNKTDDVLARYRAMGAAIAAKNRAWFHYTRPQNWAFLAGNRTNQPSSRDHLDPTKRWFPEEMEQWLPLIAAKEQEIWKLAAAPR